jgi:hypothetical protein
MASRPPSTLTLPGQIGGSRRTQVCPDTRYGLSGFTPPPYPDEVPGVVYLQVPVASGRARGGCRVVVRWLSSGSHPASLATRNRSRSRAIAARFCAGVSIALAASLLAFSPVAAQLCHETAGSKTHASTAAASRTTPTAQEQASRPAAHSPAMHDMSRHQASAPAMRGGPSITSRDCCCEGEGHESSCPSCPAGASCATHGSLTALDAGEHVAAPAPVNSPEPRAVGKDPDSWFGSPDTPPPRS